MQWPVKFLDDPAGQPYSVSYSRYDCRLTTQLLLFYDIAVITKLVVV